MANEFVPELTNGEFDKHISEGVVVIDFFADWCMPCLMMAPVVEEVAEKIKEIKFGKVNVSDNQALAQKYGVSSIPAFIVFKDGEKVGQFIGGMSSEDFEEKVKEFL